MVEKDKNIKILFKKIAEEAVTRRFTSLARPIILTNTNTNTNSRSKIRKW